jgi:hypothetical protein
MNFSASNWFWLLGETRFLELIFLVTLANALSRGSIHTKITEVMYWKKSNHTLMTLLGKIRKKTCFRLLDNGSSSSHLFIL